MNKVVLFCLVAVILAVSANAQRLSHQEALNRIRAAGIGIVSSGGCSNRNNGRCTSLDTIRVQTINGIIAFRRRTGCTVTITGGTETGHAGGEFSHWNGFKVDIGLNDCVNNFIQRNFRANGRRGDGAALFLDGRNIYARERNHWDITYF
jgi:hypothetical protein